jgi:hypothetical protein
VKWKSDSTTELEVEFHDGRIDHNDLFDLNEVFQKNSLCASG